MEKRSKPTVARALVDRQIGRFEAMPPSARERCVDAYQRIAAIYDIIDMPYEYLWKRRLRRYLFARTSGRILDVGIGTGCNLPFYPAAAIVTGIDQSGAMLARARTRAAGLGREMTLLERGLPDTRLPSAGFDCVVASFIICCIPAGEQPAAFAELRRLAGREGRIFVLDYTLPTQPLLRAFMRATAPMIRTVFAARYDTDAERCFGPAGLRVEESRKFLGGAVTLHILAPEATAPLAAGADRAREKTPLSAI